MKKTNPPSESHQNGVYYKIIYLKGVRFNEEEVGFLWANVSICLGQRNCRLQLQSHRRLISKAEKCPCANGSSNSRREVQLAACLVLDAALALALLTTSVVERGIICLCGCLKPRRSSDHSHAFQEACILFGDTLDKAQQDRTEQK